MNIAIVGAGWAGLAAAVRLKDLGATVTVFEAAPVAGGRARGVDDLHMGRIDNGQHLLLGAYTETLKLIERLQPERPLAQLLSRTPLQLESADGSFRLLAPRLPAPFNTLIALLTAKGLPLSDRLKALRMMVCCRLTDWQAQPNETVQSLLKRYKQPDLLCLKLWTPLCLAALNTPVAHSCAQLFLNVLRDSLDAQRDASDLLIPNVDLTNLWPTAAAETVTMRYRHIVRKVRATQNQVEIDEEAFEACLVAIPPYAAARVLFDAAKESDDGLGNNTAQEQSEAALLRLLRGFAYRSIATLTLELEADWLLPQSMLMLDEDMPRGHVGQWVFRRAAHSRQLTVVISDAADFLKHDRTSFVDAIATQIREQCAKRAKDAPPMPAVKHQRLIVEKRACFDAVPGLARPANRSPWPRIALAGDWTDTGYPSVLEGAVRSGLRAADILQQQLAL
ncbi:MAG: hydroxysqualene dehydroxylase HpnE [Burkholderiaceae bacterium]|nr:hydroxysqualene dehydroxylase HpnE [Burkholderiaceae bacterium]MDP4969430.1 hydroxysqualene dehydroxylase HpnE [Burkholderiaceae bacterium]MDP5111452.1 hydroxysqualene dehydroxylase HpnE [Burkholderiaceae bacterium]